MSDEVANLIPLIIIPIIALFVWSRLRRKGQLTLLKKQTLFIGFSAFYLTEIARNYYRPYIYRNEINDFHIADTIGNSLGTITAIFIILTMAGKSSAKDWKITLIIILGLIIYELLNFTSDTAVDVRDIAATLIFGCLSAFTYYILLKRNPRK